MKLNTVNVVEYFSDTIQSLVSFTDDTEGNQEAETLFGEIAKENGFTDEDIEVGLEEGLFRDGYELYIVHNYSRKE